MRMIRTYCHCCAYQWHERLNLLDLLKSPKGFNQMVLYPTYLLCGWKKHHICDWQLFSKWSLISCGGPQQKLDSYIFTIASRSRKKAEMCDCFGHWFQTLSLIKTSKSKNLGPWNKILSDGGLWSNMFQFRRPWCYKVWEPLLWNASDVCFGQWNQTLH